MYQQVFLYDHFFPQGMLLKDLCRELGNKTLIKKEGQISWGADENPHLALEPHSFLKSISAFRQQSFEASSTIELTLMIPFICFLIWNILFVSFFMYDSCVTLQGSYTTALRTERLLGGIGEKETMASEKYTDAVSNHLAMSDTAPSFSITDTDVTVDGSVTLNAPGRSYYDSLWTSSISQKADEWKPVRFIRNVNKAENLMEMIQ